MIDQVRNEGLNLKLTLSRPCDREKAMLTFLCFPYSLLKLICNPHRNISFIFNSHGKVSLKVRTIDDTMEDVFYPRAKKF